MPAQNSILIWELDFYSRPILDANNKKIWELLICDRTHNWEWVQICPGDRVNSEWLAEQLNMAIAAFGQTPVKVRFFRPSMSNIILRGCKLAGLNASASRRMFAMSQWLQERLRDLEPLPLPLKLNQPPNPEPLPDALKGEKWVIASLPIAEFAGASEWSIDFGELFALPTADLVIPGLIVFSKRANGIAAWMSGVDPVFLGFESSLMGDRTQLILDAGGENRWSLATLQKNKDAKAIAEGKAFETAKSEAQGIHFLAVQSNPETEHFAGFWLLKAV